MHNKLSNYRTTWTDRADGCGHVTYIKTEIVSWDNDTITLRHDGWDSVTTKRKMNQASNQFCLQFCVYQRNFEWFVDTPQGETLPFEDGMTIERL